MKLTEYRNYAWEPDGYRAGIPNGGIPAGSVIPNVIYRAGMTPLFGPAQISEMSVACEFIYRGNKSFEQAWIDLLRKLQPLNTSTAMLKGLLNDNTAVQTEALITIPQQADAEVNTLTIVFVSVQPFFSGTTRTASSQVFA
jgi:hypothetical protein